MRVWWSCEGVRMWGCESVWSCEGVRMWGSESVWSCEGVMIMWGCESVWSYEGVMIMWGCESVWSCEGVMIMWGCESVWSCEGVMVMWGCESVWSYEGVRSCDKARVLLCSQQRAGRPKIKKGTLFFGLIPAADVCSAPFIRGYALPPYWQTLSSQSSRQAWHHFQKFKFVLAITWSLGCLKRVDPTSRLI